MRIAHFAAAATFGLSLAGTAFAATQPLVDAAWVKANLGKPGIVVLDIRDPEQQGQPDPYIAGHIPGAANTGYATDPWRANIDGAPGMLPPAPAMEKLIGGLGIDNKTHVVIVHHGSSSSDFGSATRVYWTFKVLGHDDVSILDGGMTAWKADRSAPIETGNKAPSAKTFTAKYRPELRATTEEVEAAVKTGGATLVDARPVEQYLGEQKAGTVKEFGTIPGAINLEQGKLVQADGVLAEQPVKVAALMQSLGLKTDGPQIAFCNTGHWASIAWFTLSEVMGNKSAKMYDASMSGWTQDAKRPVVKGGGKK
jgi:thiosulfate/3-mercaptopyruvate sulfurtransferase